jgi:hypothetical protein
MRWGWRKFAIAAAVFLSAAVPTTLAIFAINLANGAQITAELEENANATTYANRADVNKESRCSPLPAEARADCEAKEDESARQAEHDEHDLAAQRATAIWTRYMGAAAILGTAFGIFGIALVLLTFWENRRAAEAAISANKIALDTSRRELRAYVVVTGIALTGFEAGKAPAFDIELINSGQTPALRLHIIANPFFYRLSEDEPKVRFPREGGPVSRMTLTPNKPFIHPDQLPEALTKGQAEALNNGEWGCIYAGVIVYRDIFRRRRMTTFRARFDRNAPEGCSKLQICGRGNYTG